MESLEFLKAFPRACLEDSTRRSGPIFACEVPVDDPVCDQNGGASFKLRFQTLLHFQQRVAIKILLVATISSLIGLAIFLSVPSD